jgi:Domain of Unknown Function (DUF349)
LASKPLLAGQVLADHGSVRSVEEPSAGASNAFGRVDAEGTVYLRTPDGERVVGSWLAGSPEEGLAYFGRKYEDLAAEVAILEKRVAADPARATSSATRLRTELTEAAVVGDIAALDARLAVITDAAAERQSEVAEEKAAARLAAIAVKEELVSEAERLALSEEWRHADDKMRQLVDRWKGLARLDRKTDDALWTRLSAARSTVQRRRRTHFAEVEERRKAAQTRKEELVAEAEKLATSTSWGPTTSRLRDLMTEWKAAGGAPKAAEADLWGRFRAAQDAFFAARTASRAERDAGFAAAVEAREALLVEAEALDTKSDAAGARKRLRDIQRRWEDAPPVSREASSNLERRLAVVEEKLRDVEQSRFRPDPTDNPLVIRLNESIAKLERRIERAEKAGDSKAAEESRAALEAQRGWLAQAIGS